MDETAPTLPHEHRAIRRAFWAVFALFFFWIMWKNAVPLGKMTVTYTVPKGNGQLQQLNSKDTDRLIGTKNEKGNTDYFQYITQPPLTFDVRVPRPFQKATIRFTYQNPNAQPVLRVGVQQAGPGFLYKDLAVNEPSLDALPAWWQKMTDGETALWVRNTDYEKRIQDVTARNAQEQKKIDAGYNRDLTALRTSLQRGELTEDAYDEQANTLNAQHDADIAALSDRKAEVEKDLPALSVATVQQFLSEKPDVRTTLTYNYTLPLAHLAGYRPADKATVVPVSLRGSHSIKTYIGDGETLSFLFTIQDINRHKEKDQFKVIVSDGTKNVFSKTLEPLGETLATGIPSPESVVVVEKSGLPEGTYTVNIQTEDDVFMKRIETRQRYVMFAKSLYLAENSEYAAVLGDGTFSPSTVYTDGTALEALTSHPAGIQVITAGRALLKVGTVKETASVRLADQVTKVVVPQNDVKLTGDGYFAFSNEQMFSVPPDYAQYVPGMDLDGNKAIIAHYPQPKKEGDWLVATVTLDQGEVYTTKDHKIRFAITMPGLAENGRALKVRQVKIILEKDPLSVGRVWNKLVALTAKLFKK